jgi:hypothetical protein
MQFRIGVNLGVRFVLRADQCVSATLWQDQLSFKPAAREGVRQTFKRVGAATTGGFVFAGASSNFVQAFLKLRLAAKACQVVVSRLTKKWRILVPGADYDKSINSMTYARHSIFPYDHYAFRRECPTAE